MTRRFDAVLFDFGGVLVSSPFDLLGSAGEGTGVAREVVLELMMGDYAVDGDHPWHRLERGEIGIGEYAAELQTRCDAAGVTLDFSSIGSAGKRLEVQDEMVDAARRLKNDGYKTAIVTNNVREFGGQWRAMLALDELFDAVVDSCEVGVRKPNPAIFRIALDALGGVEPERAVFLDDAPGNVDGARAAGLTGILVDDPGAALRELESVLEG